MSMGIPLSLILRLRERVTKSKIISSRWVNLANQGLVVAVDLELAVLEICRPCGGSGGFGIREGAGLN